MFMKDIMVSGTLLLSMSMAIGCWGEPRQREAAPEAEGHEALAAGSCSKPGHVFCTCIQACTTDEWCRTRTAQGDCEPPPEPLRPGFYKTSARPSVFLVYNTKAFCHVQNEDQMAAFGGGDKVVTVSRLNFGGRKSTGDCGWPNGFFKRAGAAECYRMYGSGISSFNIGDGYCHVVDDAQMIAFGGYELMREVSSGSDLGRGRTFAGDCPNP